MNVLIVAAHYCVCSARYATAAFERLGHTVRHVGPAMGREIWGLTLPAEYEWTPDDIHIEEEQSWNKNGCYSGYQEADLLIVMDSDPAILDAVARFNSTPMVVWGVDNHVRNYRREYFDHYFLAHRNVSLMPFEADYKPHGIENGIALYANMTWLPCAYDPTLHTPSPIAYEDRAYDVAMIGFLYPQRWALVQELRAAGLKVLAGCGLVYDAYVQAYHNARISLCLSFNGDVGCRVFETAALGNLVVTDACADFALLQPDGMWILDSEPSAAEQIKALLADPVTAQAQIAKSLAWVKSHTWDARAQVVIDWYAREHGTVKAEVSE
jgi:hypothetical protein